MAKKNSSIVKGVLPAKGHTFFDVGLRPCARLPFLFIALPKEGEILLFTVLPFERKKLHTVSRAVGW